MKATWLHNGKDRNRLILFCNGWGMDGNPFRHLASLEYDVFMLYDYRHLTPPEELPAILRRYDEVHLIAWSVGVWVGQKLFAGQEEVFKRTLAVNGTLCPVNDRLGIPTEIFAGTLNGFGQTARFKFYRRMCREKSNFRSFLAKQPQRSLEDQREELASLGEMVDCLPADQALYREILVAEYDWIIPSENQRHFWGDKRITLVSGFHYLFNLWQSWDHLLSFADGPLRLDE